MDIVESRLSGPPSLTEVFGRYSITWPLSDGLEVVVTADRLRVHSDRVTASVRVAATPAGHETLHLSYSTVNVASAQSRRGLARDLEARFKTNGLEWDSIIEVSSRMLLEALEAGSPPERLTHTEHTRPEHLLHPLVLAGLPTLLYSPGGQGKSWVAMFVAILLENGINFEGGTGRQASTLYLDWEVTRQEAGRRATLIANGLRRPDIRFPLYRRCVRPLADETSELAKMVAEHDIELVILDSVGPACGDIMAPDLIIRAFNAVRHITSYTGAAALLLGHTTKEDRKQGNQYRLPLGSIYFENLPRATWELRSEEGDSDVLEVGLFSRKSNLCRPEPIGLRFTFEPDAVRVATAAPRDVASGPLALRDLILGELEHGPGGPSDLAEAIGTTPGMVSKLLTDLKERGLVANTARGKWELTSEVNSG